jgi:hypothetical protein
MPITLDTVTLEYKSLPLILNEDGTATVTLRKGYISDSVFVALSTENYYASKEEVSAILDAQGIQGLTRRNDLSLALYQFCVSKGAQSGLIS